MDRIQGRKSHSDRLDYPESRKKRTSGQFGSVSWPAGRRSDCPEVEQTDSSPEILTRRRNIDDVVERGVQEQGTMVIIGFAPEKLFSWFPVPFPIFPMVWNTCITLKPR